jgi:A/G-specific adenine glycosylase
MTLKNASSVDKAANQNAAFYLEGAFLHSRLLAWYRKHERPLPWRVLWKKHLDPWPVWVSEIMLQQTLIQSVMPIYERFLTRFPTPNALALAENEEIRLAVRGLGYYRRFDLLHKACRKLLDEGRSPPTSYDEWLELPGIGPYTAAAIASITLDAPHGVVDGNVERVFCRLLDIRTAPNLPHLKKQFKWIMDDICLRGDPGAINQSVMELGQTVCTPSNPACPRCPMKQKCRSFQASSQLLAPAPKAKQQPIDVNLRLKIYHSDSEIELHRRPGDAKFLKGTWGFETSQLVDTNWFRDGAPPQSQKSRGKAAGPRSGPDRPLGKVKHSITKHRITADVISHSVKNGTPSPETKRLSYCDVEKNLVSNLDRKAWTLFLKSDRMDSDRPKNPEGLST